jgi:RNA 2',3'-cyclic 3'-phosphodiesterase
MRLFIASSFPDAITRDLNDRVQRLRPRLPSASWVRPEAHHVTYAFLGEQTQALAEGLAPALRQALASIATFPATLSGSGFFPNARRARVGWVGLQPEEEFQSIASAVRAVVTAAGVVLDRAEFRPHLTLMRIRDPWPPASTDLFESSLRTFRSEPFTVHDVTLFSSRLMPDGAVHTPVESFTLRAS